VLERSTLLVATLTMIVNFGLTLLAVAAEAAAGVGIGLIGTGLATAGLLLKLWNDHKVSTQYEDLVNELRSERDHWKTIATETRDP